MKILPPNWCWEADQSISEEAPRKSTDETREVSVESNEMNKIIKKTKKKAKKKIYKKKHKKKWYIKFTILFTLQTLSVTFTVHVYLGSQVTVFWHTYVSDHWLISVRSVKLTN